VASPLLKRLALSEDKIATLASGITALAEVRRRRSKQPSLPLPMYI
jgi:hypothetical protein